MQKKAHSSSTITSLVLKHSISLRNLTSSFVPPLISAKNCQFITSECFCPSVPWAHISQTIDFHKKRNFVLLQIFYEKIECSEKFSKKKITKMFVLKPQSRCKEAVNIWTELRCRQKELGGTQATHSLQG